MSAKIEEVDTLENWRSQQSNTSVPVPIISAENYSFAATPLRFWSVHPSVHPFKSSLPPDAMQPVMTIHWIVPIHHHARGSNVAGRSSSHLSIQATPERQSACSQKAILQPIHAQ
jgi:hypothetical protein